MRLQLYVMLIVLMIRIKITAVINVIIILINIIVLVVLPLFDINTIDITNIMKAISLKRGDVAIIVRQKYN